MSSSPSPLETAPAAPIDPPPTEVAWRALAQGAIVCALGGYGILRIAGPDSPAFLQGQLSNDCRALGPGRWQFTSFNSPKGRMLACFVLWAEADGFRALLPRDILEPVRKRLSMYVLRSKVALTDISPPVELLGLAGPAAAGVLRDVLGGAPEPGTVLERGGDRVLGLPGGRFLLVGDGTPASSAGAVTGKAAPVPAALWDWLGVRAGIPAITAATQDLFVPQTANLDVLGGLSFDKGCYTGQEIVARTQYLGRLKERLALWHGPADAVPGARLYSPVFGDQACGTVVNAAPAPEGGADLCAVVQTAAIASGDVRLGSPDGAALRPLPLPYALPEPATPARRPV